MIGNLLGNESLLRKALDRYLFVTDQGELLSVGGPGGDVDGSLATKEFGEDRDLVVFERHQAQFNVFVGRMTGDAAFVGEEDKGLAVGRKVREPVVAVVARHLLLIGAVVFIRQICMCPVRSELK